MKVTVFGATGLIGSLVVEEFSKLSEIEKIYQVVRKEQTSHSKKVENIIWKGETLPPEIYQVDAIVCCLGTTIKKAGTQEAFKAVDYYLPLMIAKQFKNYGGQNYIIVSALGADQKSKIFYNKVKGELERDLIQLNFKKLVILRPSLLLGPRNESRPGEFFAQKISPLFSPLMIGSLAKMRPIKAETVAQNLVSFTLGKTPKTVMEYLIVEK
ncbi:MAG: hypothetical protein Fur0010_27930 [Bdellovibrio sp.]